jgi:hypothetical protein
VAIWFRHADSRYPFLWSSSEQPPARWHGDREGPAQYLSDTPDGAWAEFLRHEEISELEDLAGIERALWAVEVDEDAERIEQPELPRSVLTGDRRSHERCRREANRLRAAGATAIEARAASLIDGAAAGQVVEDGITRDASRRNGRTLVLFGERPSARGWQCVERGRPPEQVLQLTRHFRPSGSFR